jgi:hypothetical protein
MKNHSVLEVDLVHVREYNQELGDALESKPAEYLPLVRPWPAVAAGLHPAAVFSERVGSWHAHSHIISSMMMGTSKPAMVQALHYLGFQAACQ